MATVIEIGVDLDLTESLKDLDALDAKIDKVEKKVKKVNTVMVDFLSEMKASMMQYQSVMDTVTKSMDSFQTVVKQTQRNVGNLKIGAVDTGGIKDASAALATHAKTYNEQVKQNILINKAFVAEINQVAKAQAEVAASRDSQPFIVARQNINATVNSSQTTVDRVGAVKAWSTNAAASGTQIPSPVVPPSAVPLFKNIQQESQKTSVAMSKDLSTPFADANKEADQLKKKLQEIQAESGKAASLKDNIKTGAGLGIGAIGADAAMSGALNAVRKPIDIGMDFTYTMSKVKAVALGDKSAEIQARDFALLTKAAREAGATTMWTAQDAAQALYYFGQAGWKTDQMLSGLTSTLQLATAGDMDLGRATDIVANVMSAFRLEASETARVVDVLSQAASSSTTDVSGLFEAMKYAAPVFKAAGYSVEELAASLGVLANSGIKESQAGTSLRMIALRLAAPVKAGISAMKGMDVNTQATVMATHGLSPEEIAAAQAMDKLGISTTTTTGKLKPFSEIMKDIAAKTMPQLKASFASLNDNGDILDQETGQVVKLSTAMNLLSQAYDGNVDALETLKGYGLDVQSALMSQTDTLAALKGIAGVEAVSAMLVLASSASEVSDKFGNKIESQLEQYKKQMYKATGVTNTMANIMADNLMGDVKLLQSISQEFGLVVFDNMEEGLRFLTVTAVAFIKFGTDAFKSFVKTIKEVGTALGYIALPISALFAGVDVLTSPFIDGLVSIKDSLQDIVKYVWVAQQIIVEFFLKGMAEGLDPLGLAYAEIGAALKDAFAPLAVALAPVVEIISYFKNEMAQVLGVTGKNKDSLVTFALVVHRVGVVVGVLLSLFIKAFTDGLVVIIKGVGLLVEGFVELGKALGNLGGFITLGSFAWIGDMYAPTAALVGVFASAGGVLTAFGSGISTVGGLLSPFILGFSSISMIVGGLSGSFTDVALGIVGIVAVLSGAGAGVVLFVQAVIGAYSGLKLWFGVDTMEQLGNAGASSFVASFLSVFRSGIAQVDDLIDFLSTEGVLGFTSVRSYLTDLFESIGNFDINVAFDVAVTDITKFVTDLSNAIATAISTAVTKTLSLFSFGNNEKQVLPSPSFDAALVKDTISPTLTSVTGVNDILTRGRKDAALLETELGHIAERPLFLLSDVATKSRSQFTGIWEQVFESQKGVQESALGDFRYSIVNEFGQLDVDLKSIARKWQPLVKSQIANLVDQYPSVLTSLSSISAGSLGSKMNGMYNPLGKQVIINSDSYGEGRTITPPEPSMKGSLPWTVGYGVESTLTHEVGHAVESALRKRIRAMQEKSPQLPRSIENSIVAINKINPNISGYSQDEYRNDRTGTYGDPSNYKDYVSLPSETFAEAFNAGHLTNKDVLGRMTSSARKEGDTLRKALQTIMAPVTATIAPPSATGGFITPFNTDTSFIESIQKTHPVLAKVESMINDIGYLLGEAGVFSRGADTVNEFFSSLNTDKLTSLQYILGGIAAVATTFVATTGSFLVAFLTAFLVGKTGIYAIYEGFVTASTGVREFGLAVAAVVGALVVGVGVTGAASVSALIALVGAATAILYLFTSTERSDAFFTSIEIRAQAAFSAVGSGINYVGSLFSSIGETLRDWTMPITEVYNSTYMLVGAALAVSAAFAAAFAVD